MKRLKRIARRIKRAYIVLFRKEYVLLYLDGKDKNQVHVNAGVYRKDYYCPLMMSAWQSGMQQVIKESIERCFEKDRQTTNEQMDSNVKTVNNIINGGKI